ncbi:hypothetical protein GCM10022205_58960 [Spinactinospora alkalitolerans]
MIPTTISTSKAKPTRPHSTIQSMPIPMPSITATNSFPRVAFACKGAPNHSPTPALRDLPADATPLTGIP